MRSELRALSRVRSSIMVRLASALVPILVVVGCGGTQSATYSTTTVAGGVHSLEVISQSVPAFRVSQWDTRGSIPQVVAPSVDVRRVNEALRSAIVADERAIEPNAKRCSIGTNKAYRGIYSVQFNRTLLSASSKVVSALLPAVKVCPGGNDGHGWIAVTVRVPSGVSLSLSDLLRDPPRAIPALVAEWKARVRRVDPGFWQRCISPYPFLYVATSANVRYFALTSEGLALGFPQAPACERSSAILGYRSIASLLSSKGKSIATEVRAGH
jgi:hypothetical protein